MEVSIRKAVEADIPAIAAILDGATNSKLFHGDLAWGDKAYDERELAAAISRGTLYVAESDGQGMVATFRLELQDTARWGQQPRVAVYVERFATAGGFRGQKLGSGIFDQVAGLLKGSTLQYIRLICPTENSRLCRYHEANGFVRADHKAKPLTAGASVVYYERPVDPNQQEQQSVTKKGLLRRLRGRS
jgi:hypothetical protein